jgi:crotonobetainyl-CoA:carnitine CoA-transferase CaiB-like acyl-CoA transferase
MSRRPIRVLDCSDISGAFCARALATIGATVERYRRGRTPADDAPELAAYYRCAPEIASIDDALAAADVVITSGRPSDLAAAGADYATLSASRPQLVVVNISPFGLTGPSAEWRGGNLIAVATGGMVYVNGWPDEPPLQPLGLQAYHVAGIHGAIGALLALRARDRDGRGQLVDISLQESVVAALEHVTGQFRESNVVARRSGTLHWTRAFRTVPARDGEVLATHMGDWDALREWITADLYDCDLSDDCWNSLTYRREHCEALFDTVARWSVRYDAGDLVERAQQRRIPFAPVSTLDQAAQHPQFKARNFFDRPLSLGFRQIPPPPDHRAPALTPAPRPLAPDPSPPAPRPSPLKGIQVLDLTWVVAGPVATRVLADHGAEVIKIEHPRTATPGPRRGGLFGNLNRGKQSVVLDLGTDAGLSVLRRLIAASDVLIENFSPRVLDNWGLDDDALRAINPRLTVVHMSGFGRSGPLRDGVSYGPTLQAQLGFTAHMRHPGGRPAGWGYSYSDMVSGYAAALAVLAALRAGGGQHIDLSQLEVLASVIGPALSVAVADENSGTALGNRSQEGMIAPHGIYPCRNGDTSRGDRWCAIAAADDAQWRALAERIDAGWLRDERFATAAARQQHAADLDRGIAEWTRGRAVESVVELLQAAGVACGAVADAVDLLTADGHLRQRGLWCEVATPEGERIELDASPIRLAATPATIRAPGPLLGEHSAAVLERVLAMDPLETAALSGAPDF